MVRRRATGLVLLVVALALATYFVDVDAAKKKKKKAGSKSVPAKVDSIKCGVCFAMVDEIVYELKKTENSTSTLDLRWGLTSEVTDGRAKRIGKVIPYKRSQLRAIEVMEGLCETMKNYGTDNAMPGEPRLGRSSKRPDEDNRDMEMVNRLKIDADDHKKFENYCEDYIESREDMITKAIREGQTSVEMEDIICFGDSSAPCGTTRHLCPIGSKGPMNGTMPCSLCPQGTFSSKPGTTECVKCPQHTNTTATGTNSSKGCVALCKPGFFGSSESGLSGIEPCHKCGAGMYQPEYGQIMCEKCPDGKGTKREGSTAARDCVSICGDGRQSTDEQCDDGNTAGGDGCDRKCQVEKGFTCMGGISSKSQCNKVVCGDRRIQSSHDTKTVEECDDSNGEGGDGCSAECKVEPGFMCAIDAEVGYSKCREVVCGDGVRMNSHDGSKMEICDDGNTENGDGCSNECVVEPGFVCDGKFMEKYTCHALKCGDGFKERSGGLIEQCDDGNTENGDGCSDRCQEEDGWQCYDGSSRRDVVGPAGFHSHDKSDCSKKPVCGDGRKDLDEGEKCDDGNTEDGDGCSSACTVEPGYGCWADREGMDGKPPPGPDEIVPDTCRRMQSRTRKADGSIEDDEDEQMNEDGTGRVEPIDHTTRIEL